MSARDDILAGLRQTDDGTVGDLPPEQLVDAYRAEILTEAKNETVAWLVKKAREKNAPTIETLASKVDRGAVRAFLGTPHYRDAMDAHRAEVLAEDGQAYDGELAMLRGLVRTLRTVVRDGSSAEKTRTEVQRLLWQHATDDATARAETTHPTTAEDGQP